MSRYRITSFGSRHAAEITLQGGALTCEIDGKTVRGTILQTAPPAYVIRLEDGRILSCAVTVQGGITSISCNGQLWLISVAEVYGEMSPDNEDSGGTAELRAPMPGRIVAVPVTTGSAVQRGDPIVVIEAMKMQNALSAPRAGTIQQIHVRSGDAVEAGQLLAKIE